MKKSLIALAVLGALSSAASAQSSVTIYGIVDVGVQYLDQGVNVAATGETPLYRSESTWAINSGYQSGSRLGFRGAEALGGNWSAVFTLESGYDVSTGMSAQGGRLFGRQAWAGLAHTALGTVALGRIATPSSGTGSFDIWGSVDPFATGWGINSLGSTFIPSNALREDNSIIWASPSWAGFKFAAQYSANISGAESAPSGSNTQGYTLAGSWDWSLLKLAATYDVFNPSDSLASPLYGNPNQKMLQLGGVVNLKFLKIHAAWANQDNVRIIQSGVTVSPGTFNPVPGAPVNNQAYMLGVSVNLLGGSILGSYQKSDADTTTGRTTAGATYSYEPDYDVWGVGFSYPFSRRTNMYIGYGESNWDGNIVTAGIPNTGAANRFDTKQFALGIRHLF
jgi:GBP family porin